VLRLSGRHALAAWVGAMILWLLALTTSAGLAAISVAAAQARILAK
jgi:hypothetical protein